MHKRSRWSLLLGLLAMVLLAAPAMAQAENGYWYSGGELLEGPGTPRAAESAGELSWTIVGSPIHVYCGTAAAARIFNGSEGGEGVFDEFILGPTCYTNLPGCQMSATTSTIGGGMGREQPWPIKVGEENQVRIENVEAKLVGSEYCKKTYGLSGYSVEGAMVGQYNNSTNYFEYVNAEGLAISGGGPQLEINGEMSLLGTEWGGWNEFYIE